MWEGGEPVGTWINCMPWGRLRLRLVPLLRCRSATAWPLAPGLKRTMNWSGAKATGPETFIGLTFWAKAVAASARTNRIAKILMLLMTASLGVLGF